MTELATALVATDMRPHLGSARRLVVKVGSALLIDRASGGVRTAWLNALAADLAALRTTGTEPVIVTSGAVALGRARLGWPPGPLRLPEKQAAAAVGQIDLIAAWNRALAEAGLVGAQALVTPEDTEARRRHLNARATLETLLRAGAVPLLNENDTVATSELRFGDNDRLAARIAQMVSADTLLLLSDVDGLYTADPTRDPAAQHVPLVAQLTAEVMRMAGEARPGVSTGGMVTKLAAARIALAAGCRMIIASGVADHPLARLADGAARATWFLPPTSPLAARKRWIAAHVRSAGVLTVDPGAALALAGGASLLAVGVRAAQGGFERGDLVAVTDPTGRIVARGLAAYGMEEMRRLIGRKSHEIEAVLGYHRGEAVIHRDDLVLEAGGL